MSVLIIPPAFTLACYRFTLKALDPLYLPPLKGSTLRGGFGHTFKRLVCTHPQHCLQQCQMGNSCPYGYVFETAPPEGSEVLRNFSEVPRPFVIQSPVDRRNHLPPGAELIFGLTLVGYGIACLPYFVAVFRELGQVGLGRTQGRYHLKTVQAVSPFTENTDLVYQAEDELLRVVNSTVNETDVKAYASTLPTDRLTLQFIIPARLKHEGRWVEQGPSFQVLIKALLNRVSSLSYFHCGQIFETDFKGMIERAARVQAIRVETHWEDWSRVSGRQHQRIEMGGLVGRVTYEGDLTEYLPLLALGEMIHVGKGTVFGNGQYRILS